MRVFTQDECKQIVKEFDIAENKNDENKQPMFYKNSVGVYNLPITLKYVEQITDKIKQKFPNIVFSNTYTREYKNGSYLKIHTDRSSLDLTFSVCLEKTTPKSWPLHVSLNTYDEKIDWDLSTDTKKYTNKYISYDMPEGVGAICEGKKYPHWRDTLECEENDRIVCVFYHWTKVPVKLFKSLIKV